MRNMVRLFGFARIFLLVRCLDSAFSALLPISVWWIFQDKSEFAQLEYIVSFALILSNFSDFGFAFYGFYGYKKQEDKQIFLERYLGGCCFFSLLLGLLALCCSVSSLLFFIFARALYLYAYRFFIIYFNLKEKMIWVNAASCCISLITLGLFFIGYQLKYHAYVFLYVVPAFSVVLFINIFIAFKLKRKLFSFFTILKPALQFSWALVLNTTFAALISNIAKIILYKKVSMSLMAGFSLIQRLTGAVYLMHGVIVSYRSKHLFLMPETELSKEFYQYFLKMFFLTMMLILSLFLINKIASLHLDDYVIFALFAATLFTCFNSFLELYFNRRGVPHFVLWITLLYSFIFYVGLSVISYSPVTLATLMLFSAFFSVLITLTAVKYIKVTRGVEI